MPGFSFRTDAPGKFLQRFYEPDGVSVEHPPEKLSPASVAPILGVRIAVPLIAEPLYQIRQRRPALGNHVIDNGFRSVGELVSRLLQLDAETGFAVSDPNAGRIFRIESPH